MLMNTAMLMKRTMSTTMCMIITMSTTTLTNTQTHTHTQLHTIIHRYITIRMRNKLSTLQVGVLRMDVNPRKSLMINRDVLALFVIK